MDDKREKAIKPPKVMEEFQIFLSERRQSKTVIYCIIPNRYDLIEVENLWR